ncbi:MAG: thioredoxin family protein [Pseudomonadota bacterium]|jgi:peroxiredoxin|nr:thioredoxin family protein [Rubrivivax sp.]MCA3256435.1 thioredoxin family protein [Rubrivivax sp.]MCE2913787.1 thioredoxin family protein [Rubrivivax sp.]MCZ8029315.1 thioredoxin family protein [Rubrivivax sp.]
MPRNTLAAALLALAAAATTAQAAPATVGQPAPAFRAVDTGGKTVALADFKGRHVVLEWVNPGCPFVVKHYGSGNLPGTQKEATARGVIWLAINSTAAGHGDHMAPAALAAWMKQHGAGATHTLMDADGTVGRAYGARTTPHMYVIDPSGTLVYAGAIDSKPTANPADIAGATNHVKAALAETLAGKPVTVAQTRPYGCSVKYAPM